MAAKFIFQCKRLKDFKQKLIYMFFFFTFDDKRFLFIQNQKAETRKDMSYIIMTLFFYIPTVLLYVKRIVDGNCSENRVFNCALSSYVYSKMKNITEYILANIVKTVLYVLTLFKIYS